MLFTRCRSLVKMRKKTSNFLHHNYTFDAIRQCSANCYGVPAANFLLFDVQYFLSFPLSLPSISSSSSIISSFYHSYVLSFPLSLSSLFNKISTIHSRQTRSNVKGNLYIPNFQQMDARNHFDIKIQKFGIPYLLTSKNNHSQRFTKTSF